MTGNHQRKLRKQTQIPALSFLQAALSVTDDLKPRVLEEQESHTLRCDSFSDPSSRLVAILDEALRIAAEASEALADEDDCER